MVVFYSESHVSISQWPNHIPDKICDCFLFAKSEDPRLISREIIFEVMGSIPTRVVTTPQRHRRTDKGAE